MAAGKQDASLLARLRGFWPVRDGLIAVTIAAALLPIFLSFSELDIEGTAAARVSEVGVLALLLLPFAAWSCYRDRRAACLLALAPASFAWATDPILAQFFWASRKQELLALISCLLLAVILFLAGNIMRKGGLSRLSRIGGFVMQIMAIPLMMPISIVTAGYVIAAALAVDSISFPGWLQWLIATEFIYFLIFTPLVTVFSAGFFLVLNIRLHSASLLAAYGVIVALYVLGLIGIALLTLQMATAGALLLAVLYIGYRAVRDNLPVVRALIERKQVLLLWKALLLWSPFSIFMAAGFWLSNRLYESGHWLQNRLEEGETASETALLAPSAILGMALEASALLSLLMVGLLFIKSFTYVFARVAVSLENKMPASLAPGAGASPLHAAQPFRQEQEYVIPPEEPERFYFVRSYAPSGCPPRFAVPQWRSGTLRRLLAGAYVMNEILPGSGRGSVHLTATGSARFIEWTLAEDEEIVFSYRSFVGMSESVRIATGLTLSAPAAIFGGLFHAYARGPGRIILLSAGRALCLEDGRKSPSVPRGRILGWGRRAAFDVIAEQRALDVFFSGIHLRCVTNDPVVIDVDERKASEGGLAHFATKFLLPF
ncbi:MAG: hypothetical protein EOM26_13745 [Alphaproteobacteria bacterium]|nr:hypothetical protein [Alphaproteobacteria bacterium]